MRFVPMSGWIPYIVGDPYQLRNVTAPLRIVVLVGLLTACADAKPATTPGIESAASVAPAIRQAPTVGSRFPAMLMHTLSGDSLRLGNGHGTRQPLTFVNLWATWCGPCKAEFPDLETLHQTYGRRGLRVVAVSTDESDADIRAFLMQAGVTVAIGRDTTNAILAFLQETGLPQSVLIGPDGTILYKSFGLHRPVDPVLKTAIVSALAGS